MEPNQDNYKAPIQNMMDGAKRDGTVGPLIGSIIIVLIILVGGLYFWGSLIVDRKAQLENDARTQQQSAEAEAQLRAQQEQEQQESEDADAAASGTVEAGSGIEAGIAE